MIALFLERLRIDVDDAHLHVVGDAAVHERFIERFVRVAELDVLADKADAHLVFGMAHLAHDLFPLLQIADLFVRQMKFVEKNLVESLARKRQRHLVDEFDVERGDDRFFFDVAEERDLLFHILGNDPLGSAEKNVGLNADLAQLFHGVLRRFRLQLLARFDVRNERQMNVDGVAAADFLSELANGFQKGKRFDVADRAADLDDDDVDAFAHIADAFLDFVGDVRNHLHGFAEVIAATFFFDDAKVDASRRPVVASRRAHRGEALVVSEIEIGLGAVIGNEDFAVLERRHRAGIDVDVRIELLQRDFETARLE